MSTRNRYVIGAALIAAGLSLPSSHAAAVKMLFVNGSPTGVDVNCSAGANRAYYAEAWGYSAAGAKVCEVGKAVGGAGAAVAKCDPPNIDPFAVATQHQARVTIRGNWNGDWNFVQEVGTLGQTVPWANVSIATHNLTAFGNCPAVTVSAISRGFEF